jgi:hypothetical protein
MFNMKPIYFLILLFLQLNTTAQIVVDFSQLKPPPGRLNTWSLYPASGQLLARAAQGGGIKALLKTQIKTTDGTVVAFTDLTRAEPFTFGSAPLVLNASQFLNLDAMVFSGSYRNTYERTGTLPVGTYQFCAQFVTPIDFGPLSAENCRVFNLRSVQLPVLMMPAAGAQLNNVVAQNAITFRWTPAIANVNPVFYRLQVWEVLNGQTPVQALRANQPLLDQQVVGTTQYIWRPQLLFDIPVADTSVIDSLKKNNLPLPPTGKQFIWTVQATDNLGNAVSDAGDSDVQGRAEPKTFFIIRRQ